MKTGSSKLTSRDLESLFHESGILERRFFPRKVPAPPPDLEAESGLANPDHDSSGGLANPILDSSGGLANPDHDSSGGLEENSKGRKS